MGLWNMVTTLRFCYLFGFSWIQVLMKNLPHKPVNFGRSNSFNVLLPFEHT
jgi:hypothetical protein